MRVSIFITGFIATSWRSCDLCTVCRVSRVKSRVYKVSILYIVSLRFLCGPHKDDILPGSPPPQNEVSSLHFRDIWPGFREASWSTLGEQGRPDLKHCSNRFADGFYKVPGRLSCPICLGCCGPPLGITLGLVTLQGSCWLTSLAVLRVGS